jgi:hypothetical protein
MIKHINIEEYKKDMFYQPDIRSIDQFAYNLYKNAINDDYHKYSSMVSMDKFKGICLELSIIHPANDRIKCYSVVGETLITKNTVGTFNTIYRIITYTNFPDDIIKKFTPNGDIMSTSIEVSEPVYLDPPKNTLEGMLLEMESYRKKFMNTIYKDIIKYKMDKDNRKIEEAINSLPG